MEKNYIITSLYKGKVSIKFFPDSHQYWRDSKRKFGATTYIGIKDKSRPLLVWQGDTIRDFLLSKKKITERDIYEAILQPDIQKKQAGDIGKEIHEWVEHYIKGEFIEMPENPHVLNGVNAFLDWAKANKVKFLSSERVVYSMKHDYMGTLDIEARIGKKRYLIDIKSANGLYNEVRMQTAAYAMADTEENGKPYDGRWAIRLSKETEQEYIAKQNAKKESKRMAAEIMNKPFMDYETPKYQVFEAKNLDEQESLIERDFKAFLNVKALYEWNKITDPFLNENW